MSAPAYIANIRTISPRVRMAARLYATGAAKTKKEASALAGLHPNYLTMLTASGGGNELVNRIVSDISQQIDDDTIDTSVIISRLGRKAIGRINELMYSASERIALDAAKDLADRAPETSKTQKLQVDAFTLTGQDAKELAAALVEASTHSPMRDRVATDGLIEIQDMGRPSDVAAQALPVLPDIDPDNPPISQGLKLIRGGLEG